MLKSEKLFGKRDSAAEARLEMASHRPAEPVLGVAAPIARMLPASITSAVNSAAGSAEFRSKLIVGPNIKLRGVEITDCDTLVVEGRVEASIDSRVIQIAELGAFIGNAEFDIAEIRGQFDGELTVRQKLVVYASGRVNGKIRYGKLVIEEGGQLTGDVQLSVPAAKALVVTAG
jgi:cytoskeletal protein CcmA (bactofilin family)